jgi:hypothetical protein
MAMLLCHEYSTVRTLPACTCASLLHTVVRNCAVTRVLLLLLPCWPVCQVASQLDPAEVPTPEAIQALIAETMPPSSQVRL